MDSRDHSLLRLIGLLAGGFLLIARIASGAVPRGAALANEAPVPAADAATRTPTGEAADHVIIPILVAPTRTPTPINVGNLIWDDLDQDGRRDAGEPGLAGVSVQIWNAAKSQLLDSDVTDANGIYQLTVASPGDYRVRVVLPNILDQFSPKDQAGGDDTLDSDINPSGASLGFTDVYTFASNLISISSIDAGIIVYRPPTPTRTPTPINVGNKVWYDIDADGVQDAGEPGLSNITVQIWNSAKTQLLDSDVTDANGIYQLTVASPGDYRVRVVLPFGASFSPKDQGSSDTLDSDINPSGASLGFTDVYTFASNLISISSIDAGLINVPATPTPTNTVLPSATPTNTATPTGAPAPAPEHTIYLPMVQR